MYFLGVDGGGTRTGFMLIDERGRIWTAFELGSCDYLHLGLDRFEDVIGEGVKRAAEAAGIRVEELDYIFLALSAYGEIREDMPRLESIVAELIPHGHFRCANDVEAGWAGSLACRPGIHLVAGTGAIGFGRDACGGSARSSGWGPLCGDEGSAHWLGRKVMELFTKQADGRMERTDLYRIVREEFDLERDLDFISTVYNTLEARRDKIANLARLLHRAGVAGDPRARAAYREAAFELALIVEALVERLDFPAGEPLSLSYSGGVFRAGELMLKPLRDYVHEIRGDIELKRPLLQPVTGAALYALVISTGRPPTDRLISTLKEEEKGYL